MTAVVRRMVVLFHGVLICFRFLPFYCQGTQLLMQAEDRIYPIENGRVMFPLELVLVAETHQCGWKRPADAWARLPGRHNVAMWIERTWALFASFAVSAAVLSGGQTGSGAGGWIALFDGKTLDGWKQTAFSGRGEVRVRDGMIVIGKGHTTGITRTGEFPRTGYELRFEAARLEGKDIFAGITFPAGDAYCSWINGGWDGTVVGLSNVDGNDASENDTSTLRDFVQGQWYQFRLAVTERRIQGWIDNDLVIDVDITGRQLGLPFGEGDLSAPLGFSSYRTVAGLRRVEYRRLTANARR